LAVGSVLFFVVRAMNPLMPREEESRRQTAHRDPRWAGAVEV